MAHVRPAGADLVRVLAALLQPGPHLHERVARRAPARVPARAHLLDRVPGPAFNPALSWPVWVLAGAAVFLGGLRIGLNLETPRGVIDVGFAGVIGGDRILDGESPYGHMPDSAGKACGPPTPRERPRPHPGERPLRVVERAWRHLRPGQLSRLCPCRADLAVVREVGLAPRCACDGDRLRPARDPRPLPRRASASAAAARGSARLRLDRVPVHRLHDERELERRDHARDPDLGLLARLVPVARGAVRRPRGLDEVRLAAARAALAHLPGRPPPTDHDQVRGRRSSSRRSPSSRSCCSSRASRMPCTCSSTAPSATSSDRDSPFSPWDWGQYHARGIPSLRAVQLILQVGVLALAGVVAMIPQRKGPLELAALSAALLARLRADLDALVVPLHPVVPALRAARAVPDAPPRAGVREPAPEPAPAALAAQADPT